jgi:hypothetical protein
MATGESASKSGVKANHHLLIKDVLNNNINDEFGTDDTHNTSIFSSKVASLPNKHPMRAIQTGQTNRTGQD